MVFIILARAPQHPYLDRARRRWRRRLRLSRVQVSQKLFLPPLCMFSTGDELVFVPLFYFFSDTALVFGGL